VHVLDPVPEAVEDHPPDDRAIGVEGVARAGVIGVARGVVGVEEIVGRVVETLERQHGTAFVTLGGVVVDDVEDDFDPCAVERPDHVPELVDRSENTLIRGIGGMGGEEGNRTVAPVVGSPRGGVLGVELKNGKEFDGGDAEIDEVGDAFDQSRVRALEFLGDARGGVTSETADVHLVNDCLAERAAERRVALPVVPPPVGDDRPHGRSGRVAGMLGRIPAVGRRYGNGGRVGVEEELVAVESESGTLWAVDTPAVDLAGAQAGNLDVPVVEGPVAAAVEVDDPGGPGIVDVIEEQ